MANRDGKLVMKKCKSDLTTAAGIAFLKMKAVYGSFESEEDIHKETEVTKCLGHKKLVQAKSVVINFLHMYNYLLNLPYWYRTNYCSILIIAIMCFKCGQSQSPWQGQLASGVSRVQSTERI